VSRRFWLSGEWRGRRWQWQVKPFIALEASYYRHGREKRQPVVVSLLAA
jgi:hypothetical protein